MITAITVAELVVSGILSAALYGGLAIGFNVVFGVTKIINFAQGEFLMLGMYAGYFCYVFTGLSPIVAAIPFSLVFFVFGYAIYALILRRVRESNITQPTIAENAELVITLGVSIFLVNVVTFIASPINRAIADPSRLWVISAGGVYVSVWQMVALVYAALVVVALELFFHRTRTGLAMLATAQEPELAYAAGVSVSRTYAFSVAISTAITALSGFMVLEFTSVYPSVGQDFLILSFVIIILGGLGSFVGAFTACVLLGLVQSFAIFFTGAWSYVIVFLVFLLILAFKPTGIFGRMGRV